MRHVLILSLALLILDGAPAAQTGRDERRIEIASAIERRIESAEPVDLAADSIALTGKFLHLKGHVRVGWLPDATIRAEEVRINDGKVQLIGTVNASMGPSSGVPVPVPPKIDFR